MPRLTIEELNELKALKKKEREEQGLPPEKEETPAPEETPIVDPATVDAAANEQGESANEPWFPKRNKRSKKPRTDKDSVQDLNGILWMIHAGIAKLTGIEEFTLDPSESKELAESIARVQAFYPRSILSPLAMAWTGLLVTAGKVYGTRLIAVTAKKKKKPEIVEIPLPPGTAKAN